SMDVCQSDRIADVKLIVIRRGNGMKRHLHEHYIHIASLLVVPRASAAEVGRGRPMRNSPTGPSSNGEQFVIAWNNSISPSPSAHGASPRAVAIKYSVW